MAKKTSASTASPAAKRDKKKPLTKSQMFQELSDKTNLSKTQVQSFFDALGEMVHAELNKKGPGAITFPGLLKLQRKEKPATKARKGRNPQTGQEITIPAKPKSTVVRARVLKNLQDSVKK